MNDQKVNPRQLAVLRVLSSEAQQAQAVLNAAQGKIQAFLDAIKAQFDIPVEVETVAFAEDGTISWAIPTPPIQVHAISDGGAASPPLALVPGVEAADEAQAANGA